MAPKGARAKPSLKIAILVTVVCAAVASCGPDRIKGPDGGPYAPGVDQRGGTVVDQLEVGHRLMDAAQYELAMDAFTRAALEQGLTGEILTAMGSANLGLGRLGQAEDLLRRAVAKDETLSGAWNNLGVVLMEQGEIPEARAVFRKAYALDNGESDSIRDNLRLALAKSEKSDNSSEQNQEYKLVQRGGGDYLLRKNQD